MPVTFKAVERQAPNGMYERLATAMETHVGDAAVDGQSAGGYCLRNLHSVWVDIGGSDPAGSPVTAGTAAQAASQMSKHMQSTPPPRGAVVCWDSSVGSGSGHIAVADGDGNSVNNWDESHVEVTPLKDQRKGYMGWVDPSRLSGGNGTSDESQTNENAGQYTDSSTNESVGTGGNKVYFEGDFKRVKEAYSKRNLRDAVFNPPLPKKWSTGPRLNDPLEQMLRAQQQINRPGFLVRDSLFAGERSEDAPKQKQKQNKTKQKSDPDSKKQRETAGNWLRFDTNYGFRFLYNPTTYSEGYTSISDADPLAYSHNISAGVQAIVGASGGSLGLNLLLYRKFDVELLRYLNSGVGLQNVDTTSIYGEKVSAKMLKKLMERGTMVDLEYLFRLCNGEPQDTWHGLSSDWGALMPTMIVVSVGDGASSRRIRGLLTGVNFTHSLFATGMIPVYTEVQLTISRVVDQYFTPYGENADVPSADLGLSGSVNFRSTPEEDRGRQTSPEWGPVKEPGPVDPQPRGRPRS